MQEKQLDQKDKVDCNTHDIITWEKTIARQILPNISQSKGNQTMKLGQLIECNKRNICLKKYVENKAGRPVSDLFLFLKIAQIEGKESGLQLNFNMFQQPSTWYTIKTNCIKPLAIDPQIVQF